MKAESGFVLGFAVGLAVMTLLLSMLLLNDNTDLINTRAVGIIICESNGLQYGHRDIVSNYEFKGKTYSFIPIIYCKNPDTPTQALVQITT